MPYPSRTSPALRLLATWVPGVLLTLAACNSEDTVGSACQNGECDLNASELADPGRCQSTAIMAEVAVRHGEEPPTAPLICSPVDLVANAQGLVSCEVRLAFDGIEGCDHADFIEDDPDSDACLLSQVPVEGDEPEKGQEGWYFAPSHADCVGGGGAMVVTDGALAWDNYYLRLDCAHTSIPVGEHISDALDPGQRVAVDPDACMPEQLSDPQDVGIPCEVSAPEGGAFDDREIVVETGGPDCDTGMCMVYQLGGDPSEDCDDNVTSCATPEDLAARVQCTCRCDSPNPDDTLCSCGDGYACVPVIPAGPLAGSYCVNEDLILPSSVR